VKTNKAGRPGIAQPSAHAVSSSQPVHYHCFDYSPRVAKYITRVWYSRPGQLSWLTRTATSPPSDGGQRGRL